MYVSLSSAAPQILKQEQQQQYDSTTPIPIIR